MVAINEDVLEMHHFLLGGSEPLAVYVRSLAAGDYASAAELMLKFESQGLSRMSIAEVEEELSKLAWAPDQHAKQVGKRR